MAKRHFGALKEDFWQLQSYYKKRGIPHIRHPSSYSYIRQVFYYSAFTQLPSIQSQAVMASASEEKLRFVSTLLPSPARKLSAV